MARKGKKGKSGWHGEPRRHGLARKGVSTVLPDGRRLAVNNYIAGGRKEVDWDKEFLTEAEINLIKNRMNRGEDVDLSNLWEGEYELTSEQTKKGLDWLVNQWKTPRGGERKNNPFGIREQRALETFDSFVLKDFYDAGSYGHSFYVPYYGVSGKDGYFEYAVYGGKIHILG